MCIYISVFFFDRIRKCIQISMYKRLKKSNMKHKQEEQIFKLTIKEYMIFLYILTITLQWKLSNRLTATVQLMKHV